MVVVFGGRGLRGAAPIQGASKVGEIKNTGSDASSIQKKGDYEMARGYVHERLHEQIEQCMEGGLLRGKFISGTNEYQIVSRSFLEACILGATYADASGAFGTSYLGLEVEGDRVGESLLEESGKQVYDAHYQPGRALAEVWMRRWYEIRQLPFTDAVSGDLAYIRVFGKERVKPGDAMNMGIICAYEGAMLGLGHPEETRELYEGNCAWAEKVIACYPTIRDHIEPFNPFDDFVLDLAAPYLAYCKDQKRQAHRRLVEQCPMAEMRRISEVISRNESQEDIAEAEADMKWVSQAIDRRTQGAIDRLESTRQAVMKSSGSTFPSFNAWREQYGKAESALHTDLNSYMEELHSWAREHS